MKTNRKVVADPTFTYEGARAVRVTQEQELRRSVAACMLWEDSFYESGKSIVERIQALIPSCRPEFVAACAIRGTYEDEASACPAAASA